MIYYRAIWSLKRGLIDEPLDVQGSVDCYAAHVAELTIEYRRWCRELNSISARENSQIEIARGGYSRRRVRV